MSLENIDWSDREAVLEAVKKDGMALKNADESLKHEDEEILLAALKQNFRAIDFVDIEYIYNYLDAAAIWALAPAELLSDRQFILQQCKRDAYALKYAAPYLQNDKEVVLAAVGHEEDGWAIEYASEELRHDKEVVIEAIKHATIDWCYAHDVMRFVPDELRADKGIWLAAVKENGYALQLAPPELRADREIVLAAVKNSGDALQLADPELRADKEIVLEAVRQYGETLLELASEELQNDPDVLAACKND